MERSLGNRVMQCFRLWIARFGCVSASLLCRRDDVYIGLLNLGGCLVINQHTSCFRGQGMLGYSQEYCKI